MALCNKFGNVLRQGAARSNQAPVSSMLNYIRCMSSSKLFIGGLSYGVDDQSLKDAFATYGDVVEGEASLSTGSRLRELAKRRFKAGHSSGSANIGPSMASAEEGRKKKKLDLSLPPLPQNTDPSLSFSTPLTEKEAVVEIHDRPPPSTKDGPISFPVPPTEGDWRNTLVLDRSDGADNVMSPWHKKFPIDQVIDKHLTDLRDMEKVKSLGVVDHYNVCYVVLTRLLNNEVGQLKGELLKIRSEGKKLEADFSLLESALTDKGKRLADVEQDLLETQAKFESSLIAMKEAQADRDSLRSSLTTLNDNTTALKGKVKKLEEEIISKDSAILDEHAGGFNRALAQVALLYPELDLSSVGMFKAIVDGRLVESSSPLSTPGRDTPGRDN